jgi:hypothetical protein
VLLGAVPGVGGEPVTGGDRGVAGVPASGPSGAEPFVGVPGCWAAVPPGQAPQLYTFWLFTLHDWQLRPLLQTQLTPPWPQQVCEDEMQPLPQHCWPEFALQ